MERLPVNFNDGHNVFFMRNLFGGIHPVQEEGSILYAFEQEEALTGTESQEEIKEEFIFPINFSQEHESKVVKWRKGPSSVLPARPAGGGEG